MRALRPISQCTLAVALALCAVACAVDADEGAAEEAPESSGGKADGQTVVDPCRSYADRLRLMRMLEDAHPYPFAGTAQAWPDGRDGFISQTSWQLQSGRAARSANGDTLWGWWPNVNYTLTAWQLTVLQERGELAGVQLVHYLDGNRFDPTPEAARAIIAYYDELDRTRADAEAGRVSPADVPIRQRRLQQLLWTLHSTAIKAGLARNEDLLAKLSFAERRFSQAWGYSVVDLLTTVNFPTDAGRIVPLNQLLLPQRVVTTSDLNPLGSSDLPASQRAGVLALIALDEFERDSNYLVLRTVQTYVTTSDRAQAASDALLDLFHTGDIRALLRVIGG